MFHHIHLFINIMKARKRWKQFQKTKFKGRWNLYNLLQTTTNHLSPISDRPFHSLARLTNHTSVPQKKHQCGRWATLVFLASHASAGKNADAITISIQTNGSKILNWRQIKLSTFIHDRNTEWNTKNSMNSVSSAFILPEWYGVDTFFRAYILLFFMQYIFISHRSISAVAIAVYFTQLLQTKVAQ